MQKLRNNRIGVDQGEVLLFSDFENGGEMWAGSGARERRVQVAFKHPFLTIPVIQLSIALLDMDHQTNQRLDLSTADITADGFAIVFKTWGDTRIARLRAAWLAIGEVHNDDDWVLD